MDVCDRADSEIKFDVQRSYKESLSRDYYKSVVATGSCNYCEEPVEGAKLYCDHECAKEHDRILKRH